jgi:hypothetical protein
MVDEIETEGAPAPAADEDLSLTDEIASAVAGQRGSEPKEIKPEQASPESGDERPRDEKGRFAAKTDDKEEPGAPKDRTDASRGEPTEAKEGVPAPNVAPDAPKPPAGFSAAAKAQWDKLPDIVKADIAKREADVDRGFKRYEGLGRFAELCERNGTTLPTAVAQYNQLENMFVRDPVAGITAICQRLNIDPRILTSAMQAQYGGMLGTQAPAQPAAQTPGQNGYQVPQFNHEALINEAVNRFNQAQSERDTQSQISAFMADPANKYFENVRQQMVAALQSGQASTLKEAYEAALWMNPETREIMLKERNKPSSQTRSIAAVTQAKAAAKAVGGSPRPGLKPGGAIDPNSSVTDTIIAAINAQRGTV